MAIWMNKYSFTFFVPKIWMTQFPKGVDQVKFLGILEIMSSKFRTVTWQKFVLNACCNVDCY